MPQNLCDDVDIVISVLGLSGFSNRSTIPVLTHRVGFLSIDFQANLNVLNRAISSPSVKHFFFLSMVHGDTGRKRVQQIEVKEHYCVEHSIPFTTNVVS